jgi:hypothetical protein
VPLRLDFSWREARPAIRVVHPSETLGRSMKTVLGRVVTREATTCRGTAAEVTRALTLHEDDKRVLFYCMARALGRPRRKRGRFDAARYTGSLEFLLAVGAINVQGDAARPGTFCLDECFLITNLSYLRQIQLAGAPHGPFKRSDFGAASDHL